MSYGCETEVLRENKRLREQVANEVAERERMHGLWRKAQDDVERLEREPRASFPPDEQRPTIQGIRYAPEAELDCIAARLAKAEEELDIRRVALLGAQKRSRANGTALRTLAEAAEAVLVVSSGHVGGVTREKEADLWDKLAAILSSETVKEALRG